jgi:hypothetical protein
MPILGILDSAKIGSLAGSFESIATLSGTGASTTISFTSIPSTYKHLQIRGIVRESSGAGPNDTFLGVRFNGDTGANYALHYADAFGTGSPSANGSGNLTWGYPGLATQNNATAGAMGTLIFDVMDYTNTNKFKVTKALSGDERFNNGGSMIFISSLWRSTVAISRIDIFSKDGQNLSTTSTLALYGIKG